MIARLTLLALAATACSPEGGSANTAAETSATTNATPPAVVAGVASQSGPPKPGDVKTFGDWTVGCDNGGACEMASLGPEAGDFPTVTMSVARDAGPRGEWSVEFDGRDGDPVGIAIDGKRIAGVGDDAGGARAAAVVAAMADGAALAALGSDGKTIATISLTGASAALRYIDATQGRAGTVTAAVAKGAKAADLVPQPAALPVVEAIFPGGAVATPTAAQVTRMRTIAGCDTEGFAGSAEPEMHALGGSATLIFVPCSAGAYNLSAALFVLKNGDIAPARADVPTGFSGEEDVNGPAQVVNGGFDDGLVTSYSKGRGLGDCGVSQSFAWDGARLRLVEQGVMGECRGNTDLITTWRARVVRK